MRVPCFALQNSKKVFVRACCFILPWRFRVGRSIKLSSSLKYLTELQLEKKT